MTLGVQETVGGTTCTGDYVECIEELVKDVDQNILSHITNTITDRCVTNCAVDKELEKKTSQTIDSFQCAVGHYSY